MVYITDSIAMYLFINRFYSSNNNYRTVGDELKKCSDNFKEIFNIFLALGADIDLMFYSLGDWEPNEQYEEFIKMLISLKDERVNKFLCERCLCGDYKFMFDLLKENNINNFEVNQAIKLISNNSYNPDDAVKCVLYLLEQGVFQAQDFNEENIKKNIDNITFDYHYKEKQFYKIFSDMIYEFEKNQTSPKKKIETKTQLLGKKKQLEKKTQAEKENDKILTNVQKNDEKVSKKSQEDKFMDSILAEAQKNVEMER